MNKQTKEVIIRLIERYKIERHKIEDSDAHVEEAYIYELVILDLQELIKESCD